LAASSLKRIQICRHLSALPVSCVTMASSQAANVEPSWTCSNCTLEHVGTAKHVYLVCELCGAKRVSSASMSTTCKSQPKTPSSANNRLPSSSLISQEPQSKNSANGLDRPREPATQKKHALAWGSLKVPTETDIRGKRRRQKGLDAPVPLMDYLVVLDFEWTADDKRKMEPTPEITQFPSVAMKLVEKTKGISMNYSCPSATTNLPLPIDLTLPCNENISMLRQDAFAVSAFDTFVKPTFNPILSDFSVQLTAITQEEVNAAPTIEEALQSYIKWLESLGLVNEKDGSRKGNWCFATWGDVDIMNTLRQELQHKGIQLPPCFDRWINLKCNSMFKKHYGREPRGGLRACVESVGARWHGRAHNGLVDSFNTAKIVRHMVQTGFRFTRATRGLDKNGVPFGEKR
jgi:inhibitor of KinA sporulation pathway (predicted exonuclease)